MSVFFCEQCKEWHSHGFCPLSFTVLTPAPAIDPMTTLIDKIESLILGNKNTEAKIEEALTRLRALEKSFKPCSVCQHMYSEEAMKDNTCAHCVLTQNKLNLFLWSEEVYELCLEIEKLPASPEQTELSIKASKLFQQLRKEFNKN